MNFLHKNFLKTELVKWQELGLINQDSAEKIAKIYDVDLQHRGGSNFILRLVAYLFFGLSLFTLIGANWEELPRILRLILVLGVLLFVNFSAFFQLKKGNEKYAITLFFLGNLCYGAAIALVAQIYHLGEHMPNGVLLWASGAFLLGFALQNGLISAQGLILAMFWFSMEFESYKHVTEHMHGFLVFILISCYVFYKSPSKLLLMALFIAIAEYLFIVPSVYHYVFFNEAYICFFAYLLFATCVSFILDNFYDFSIAEFLRKIAIGMFFILFLSCLMQDNFDYESGNFKDFFKGYYGILYMFFTATSIAILVKFKKHLHLILPLISLSLPVLFIKYPYYASGFFSVIGVIIGAFLIKVDKISIGLAFIFTVSIVRYIELLGDYIGASLLFMVFAVIVLIVARNKRVAK